MVKENHCGSTIEIPYYSAKYEGIRYYCGTLEELNVSPDHRPQTYR